MSNWRRLFSALAGRYFGRRRLVALDLSHDGLRAIVFPQKRIYSVGNWSAVDVRTNRLVASGQRASKLRQKMTARFSVERFLQRGRLVDLEIFQQIWQEFGRRLKLSKWRPYYFLIGVPWSLPASHQDFLIKIIKQNIFAKCQVIDRGLAGYFYLASKKRANSSSALILIDEQVSQFAFFRQGKKVAESGIFWGYRQLKAAIVAAVRQNYQLMVDEVLAEHILANHLQTIQTMKPHLLVARGKNIVSGLPESKQIDIGKIAPLFLKEFATLVSGLQDFLSSLSPADLDFLLKDGLWLFDQKASTIQWPQILEDKIKIKIMVLADKQAIVKGLYLYGQNEQK